MNKHILLVISFLLSFMFGKVSFAQEAAFTPPFDFPIQLSGNFGEIRANHFHGGLDFKTGGAIGKPVRALSDGYISRIRVTHGSGYVLDVTYNNGYKTINRHLSAFVGDIAERVKNLQYEKESWEVEIVPQPNEYNVKAGEIIALSGNTGYSFGPHLHLDMFETSTDDYIDPLPFFKNRIKDNVAPRADGMMIFPQRNKGVVNEKSDNYSFTSTTKQPITAWGVIGIGIKAYDYMDGVRNRLGVHTVILEVDSVEVFRSVVDRFSNNENRMIESWTHGKYMKSFIEPGNTLRLLKASNNNRGLITIDEERPYHFVYTLKDALGNTSKVRFTLHGKQSDRPSIDHKEKYIFHWDRVNYIQERGVSLLVVRGMLYDDAYLDFKVITDSCDIAYTYQINNTPITLHGRCELGIRLRNDLLKDKSKYYIASINQRGKKSSVGGVYKDGFMKTTVRELGTFTVLADTIPPRITPLNRSNWAKTKKIVFKVKDEETGIYSYRGTIDGEYALFGKPNSVNGNLVYEVDTNRIKRGKHTIELTVTDGCGNSTTHQCQFVW